MRLGLRFQTVDSIVDATWLFCAICGLAGLSLALFGILIELVRDRWLVALTLIVMGYQSAAFCFFVTLTHSPRPAWLLE